MNKYIVWALVNDKIIAEVVMGSTHREAGAIFKSVHPLINSGLINIQELTNVKYYVMTSCP